MGFAHLHLHTEYSLLDGANGLNPLVREAAQKKMAALAITDHGNLHGAMRFHEACLTHEVQPILGCEFYVAPNSRLDRGGSRGSEKPHHLILLAQNLEGWRNLMALSTASFKDGFYYKPRIDKALLQQHAAGLVCLSACLSGEVPSLLMQGMRDEAFAAAQWYKKTFGQDRYFLELQDHGIAEQKSVNQSLMQFSKDLSLTLVATNDAHYLRQEDASAHEVLLCIGTGTHMEDPNHFKFDGDQFYLKDEDEMRRRFSAVPEAVENTVQVAQMCRFDLPRAKALMPGFTVPEGEKDEASWLRKETYRGLKRRFGNQPSQAAVDRVERELGVIEEAGFPGYFLVVADFVNEANKRGIPVGPGRGSAAGSIVSYCLGITDLDPLHYGLLFERFLNPERIQPPDIDIDFADHGRDEIIAYVKEKYGSDKVAQIITFGTLGAKAVVRDVGRAMNYPYGEVDALARLIPFELNITLDAAAEQNEELRKKIIEPRMSRLWDRARRLEGLARHASTHAAGVVICPEPLEWHVPLSLDRHGERGEDDENGLMTQWDMGSLEKVGLIKMDFLGLRTLTVIDETLKRLKAQNIALPQWEAISMDDPQTYEMLTRGDSHGVFQLESSGMKDRLRRFKPRNERDLGALVALYRPGPMQMIDEFLLRRSGAKPVEYALPQLEPILSETFGTILYQEQVMQIAVAVGGFSLAQADLLRRAMAKKKADLLEEQRGIFLQGAIKKGVSHAAAEAVFELMARFAEYGFNKSHAAAYAVLAFRTAWLKRHHASSFLAALMTSEAGNTDRLRLHLSECRRFNVSVQAPDVNKSEAVFSATGREIRFGLAAVRNMGWQAAESVVSARGSGYMNMDDFLTKIDTRLVNARAVESLIKAGALDSFAKGGNRAQLIAALPIAMDAAQQLQRDRESGQESLFGDLVNAESPVSGSENGVPQWEDKVRLAFEKEALGCYLSGHPLAQWEGLLRALRVESTAQLPNRVDGSRVQIAGMLTKVKPLLTRKQESMYRVELEDLDSSIEVMIWPKVAQNMSLLPKEESMILVRGRVENTERLQLSAESCLPLANAWTLVRALHLEMDPQDDKGLEMVSGFCQRSPGGLPIYLHWMVNGRSVTQKLGPKAGFANFEGLYAAACGFWGEKFWFET